jgi:GAF domain-containing protein
MAKKRNPQEDHEEEIMKKSIQKRFESMFTGEGEPLTNMSINEVESLKARVAELEAKLAEEPAAAESVPVETESRTITRTSAEESNLVKKQEKEGFFRSLLRAPILDDASTNRVASLQHKILLGLFVASSLSIVTLVWNWSVTTPMTVAVVLLAIGLFVLASHWQRNGHVERTSWVLVGTLYSIVLFSALNSGLSPSTVIQAAIVISLAGLLLRPIWVVVVTLITLISLSGLQYIAPFGQIELTQLIFTILILGLEGLLLTVASHTLEQSFAEADRSTQDLRRANQSLQGLTTNLETRVEERTHDLELASEVGRTISEKVNNLSEMLTEAVEMIRARFNLYYTQIYLTDPSGKSISLRAGTGEVGKELLQRGHSLPVDSRSLNGRAASEKRGMIVADVKDNINFLPNPLLSKTRSEMAIPLIVAGKVVGVLDMQSEQPGALNEMNLPAFEALAGQLAIAIQNANLFAQAEEARAEVETQIRRFTEQGWQDFLNAIDRGEKIGFTFGNNAVNRLKPDEISNLSPDNRVNIPITVTGTKIGEIQIPVNSDRAWTPNEIELVQATSAQLAQHVENLRLLAQADQYRVQAEQAARRLTREAWDSYLQTYSETESGYEYDLTEVKPLFEKEDDSVSHAIKYPVQVRDETIGEMIVDVADHSDEVDEILTAVTEQLSGHIENLRLSELNEIRAQREHTLRQITIALRSSTNPATIMRTAAREIGSILGRKTVVQLATPEQAKLADPAANNKNASGSPVNHS